MNWRMIMIASVTFALLLGTGSRAEDLLFEDKFETELSDKWQITKLEPQDYRLRDGGLEIRLKPGKSVEPAFRVDLPISTSDSVVASVEISCVGEPLRSGEISGLCLTNNGDAEFTVSKTNIDGYQVFSPGEAEFIGQPGEEGDPINYTVKYWPADERAGALRLIVRSDYAYFQTGPSKLGTYKTVFHSAISASQKGLGFGLVARGNAGEGERWVRFRNFRVTKS